MYEFIRSRTASSSPVFGAIAVEQINSPARLESDLNGPMAVPATTSHSVSVVLARNAKAPAIS